MMEKQLRRELVGIIRKTIKPVLKEREHGEESQLAFPFHDLSFGKKIKRIFDSVTVEETALAIEEYMDSILGRGKTTPSGMSSDILNRIPSMEVLVRYVRAQIHAARSVNWELEKAAEGTI